MESRYVHVCGTKLLLNELPQLNHEATDDPGSTLDVLNTHGDEVNTDSKFKPMQTFACAAAYVEKLRERAAGVMANSPTFTETQFKTAKQYAQNDFRQKHLRNKSQMRGAFQSHLTKHFGKSAIFYHMLRFGAPPSMSMATVGSMASVPWNAVGFNSGKL